MVDGAIRVDRVTLARVAKTLLSPRSPTHRTDRSRDRDREGSRDRCACKNSQLSIPSEGHFISFMSSPIGDKLNYDCSVKRFKKRGLK